MFLGCDYPCLTGAKLMFLDCEDPCLTGGEFMFLYCEDKCLTGGEMMFLDCEDPCLTGDHVLFSVCVLQRVPRECFQPATANIDCLNPEAYLYFFFFSGMLYTVYTVHHAGKGKEGRNFEQ